MKTYMDYVGRLMARPDGKLLRNADGTFTHSGTPSATMIEYGGYTLTQQWTGNIIMLRPGGWVDSDVWREYNAAAQWKITKDAYSAAVESTLGCSSSIEVGNQFVNGLCPVTITYSAPSNLAFSTPRWTLEDELSTIRYDASIGDLEAWGPAYPNPFTYGIDGTLTFLNSGDPEITMRIIWEKEGVGDAERLDIPNPVGNKPEAQDVLYKASDTKYQSAYGTCEFSEKLDDFDSITIYVLASFGITGFGAPPNPPWGAYRAQRSMRSIFKFDKSPETEFSGLYFTNGAREDALTYNPNIDFAVTDVDYRKFSNGWWHSVGKFTGQWRRTVIE